MNSFSKANIPVKKDLSLKRQINIKNQKHESKKGLINENTIKNSIRKQSVTGKPQETLSFLKRLAQPKNVAGGMDFLMPPIIKKKDNHENLKIKKMDSI